MSVKPLTTCLWFDGQAEAAAEQYASIFKNAKVGHKTYYSSAGQDTHGQQPQSVMTVEFEINGSKFVGLNGGPAFQHGPAVSFMVDCADQDEVDYYWARLSEGGDASKQNCGWTVDRFGVSWQVIPTALKEILAGDDREGAGRVTEAMMGMKKLDIAGLRKAYEGKGKENS